MASTDSRAASIKSEIKRWLVYGAVAVTAHSVFTTAWPSPFSIDAEILRTFAVGLALKLVGVLPFACIIGYFVGSMIWDQHERGTPGF